MDEEIKSLLHQNLQTSRESLSILKKIHRAQKIARALKVVYWLVIIAGIFGAYYYLRPVIANLIATYNDVRSTFTATKNVSPTLPQLPELTPDMVNKLKQLFQ